MLPMLSWSLGWMLAHASPDPSVFAGKYVVIVATERSEVALAPIAARLKAVPGLEPIRLSSKDFDGLRPCYELLVARAFDDRKKAMAYAEQLKGSSVEAYVRATGRYRAEAERRALCTPPPVWIVEAGALVDDRFALSDISIPAGAPGATKAGALGSLRPGDDLKVALPSRVAECEVAELDAKEYCEGELVPAALLQRCSTGEPAKVSGVAAQASVEVRTFAEAPASSFDFAPWWAEVARSPLRATGQPIIEGERIEKVFTSDGQLLFYLAVQPNDIGRFGLEWARLRVGEQWVDVIPLRLLKSHLDQPPWFVDVGADQAVEAVYTQVLTTWIERGGEEIARFTPPECTGC